TVREGLLRSSGGGKQRLENVSHAKHCNLLVRFAKNAFPQRTIINLNSNRARRQGFALFAM
ncbi:MAG: hypothetical protein AAFX07_13545, partial [Pseudomonadota bacterium]